MIYSDDEDDVKLLFAAYYYYVCALIQNLCTLTICTIYCYIILETFVLYIILVEVLGNLKITFYISYFPYINPWSSPSPVAEANPRQHIGKEKSINVGLHPTARIKRKVKPTEKTSMENKNPLTAKLSSNKKN